MDWSDETEARLEEEEKRLRHKAANLQERHGTWSLMARQELAVADDIRAALEEIRRVTAERDEWKRLAHVEAKGVRCAFEERAEAAEAKLTEAQADLAQEKRDRAWWAARLDTAEAKLAEAQGVLDSLKTEAGKAAFALANGWPLPEEVMALEAKLAEAEARIGDWVARCESLDAKVETLLNQNQEIAASNADHVRWHREKEAEVERLRESASRHVCESHTGCADLLAAAKTAEIERLLCIISPGDAAAFEEHMAAREAHWVAQVERLREALTGSERVLRGWAVSAPKGGSLTYELEADILRAALRGGGE